MSSKLNLRDLIAAPIKAINEAEAHNAMTFVDLLSKCAFKQGRSPDLKELETTNFTMKRMNPAGEIEERNIEIPLIQLLPFNSVGIDSVQLDYDLEINADPTRNSESGVELTAQFAQFTADGKAKSGSVNGNINIKMELKRSEFPQGILDLLQQTAGGIDTPTSKSIILEKRSHEKAREWIEFTPLQEFPVRFKAGDKFTVDLQVKIPDHIKCQERPLARISAWPKNAFTLLQPKEIDFFLEPAKENALQLTFLSTDDFDVYAKSTMEKLSVSIDVSACICSGETLSSTFRVPLRLT